LNKVDLRQPAPEHIARLKDAKVPYAAVVATTWQGIDIFRSQLLKLAPAEGTQSPVILRDLVREGETAVLVAPIDKEAPKGRIKQLQVQAIRDLLDANASCLVVQDTGLKSVLENMKQPPKLVVTDAAVFDRVAQITPDSIPITAFSILFSRLKGDLVAQSRAILEVESLRVGDKVLIAESCTHHPIEDDIGRVKIPNWLEHYVGGKLQFTVTKGRDFPADLSEFKLVIHCGACMWNRTEMMSRIRECQRQGVPITNYGLLIAYVHGILDRALEPFPEARAAYVQARGKLSQLSFSQSERESALVM
jgi:[FeFe] hydrogenase H-cluster maturation GTPase HydF